MKNTICNTSRKRTFGKKLISAIAAALLLLACAVPAAAGNFDDYYDYQDADGTYAYYFTQGIIVHLNENWYQKTIVIPDDYGASFYHKASWQAYQDAGSGDGGGFLFSISASVNTDFQNLPSFAYIGFNEEQCMNYFAMLPTDYRAYMADETIRAEYDALFSEVEDVIADIELVEGSETASSDNSGPGEPDAGEDAVYTDISCNDTFSLKIPSGWEYWQPNNADIIFASPDGRDTPPIISVKKVGENVRAGDYILQLRDEFLELFRDCTVEEPEVIGYTPDNSDRRLAGYRGVFRVEREAREYTVLEYLEYFGDDLYQYSCCYVSRTQAEDDHEDETTLFAFMHILDTMQVNA